MATWRCIAVLLVVAVVVMQVCWSRVAAEEDPAAGAVQLTEQTAMVAEVARVRNWVCWGHRCWRCWWFNYMCRRWCWGWNNCWSNRYCCYYVRYCTYFWGPYWNVYAKVAGANPDSVAMTADDGQAMADMVDGVAAGG